MSSVNELKWTAVTNITGKTGSLNGIEHLWLEQSGLDYAALNEMWYNYFITFGNVYGAKPGLSWNENAYIWLGGEIGITAADTLSERWWQYWNGVGAGTGASGGYVFNSSLNLGAQSGIGNRVGFRKQPNFGNVTPDELLNGDDILELTIQSNNGKLRFIVEGIYPKNEYKSLEIVGVTGELLTLDSDWEIDTGANKTTWEWDTGDVLVDSTVYLVTFT
jgi:hypothetical protein